MEYTFTVKHIKGSSNSTADSLSRLPVRTPGTDSAPFPMVHDAAGMALPKGMTGLPTAQQFSVSEFDFDILKNHLTYFRFDERDLLHIFLKITNSTE